MIIHGNKQISEIVYARKASEGGGAVRLTNIIRGAQVVFGGLRPSLAWQLKPATKAAILAAFGQTDGKAVIKATNAYLNALEATDTNKATALAGFINEDPMLVCSLGLQPQGVDMPYRFIKTTAANQYYRTGVSKVSGKTFREEAIVKYDKTSERRLQGVSGNNSEYWGVTASNYYEKVSGQPNNISLRTTISYSYSEHGSELWFFAINYGNKFSGAGCYRSESKIYSGDILVRDYIPFKKDGKMEFLNMLDFTLATRVGEPSEYYELPDGTPWTPLNQTT